MAFVNKDIIGLINDVAKLLRLHKLSTIHFGGLRWNNIPPVSPQELHAWLTGLPPTCQHFNSAWKIIQWLVRLSAHSHFCPIVRYFYPFEERYNTDVMESVFGWTYYGSADPVLFDPMKNCAGSAPTHKNAATATSLEYACVSLGLCYLFLEFFLPVVILRSIIPYISPGVSHLDTTKCGGRNVY